MVRDGTLLGRAVRLCGKKSPNLRRAYAGSRTTGGEVGNICMKHDTASEASRKGEAESGITETYLRSGMNAPLTH